jgi:hypothetical protein
MLVLDVPARDQLSRQIEELRRTCRSVTVGRRCLQMCDGVLFIRGEGIVDVGVRGRNGRPARPSPHPSPVDAAGERGLLRPALSRNRRPRGLQGPRWPSPRSRLPNRLGDTPGPRRRSDRRRSIGRWPIGPPCRGALPPPSSWPRASERPLPPLRRRYRPPSRGRRLLPTNTTRYSVRLQPRSSECVARRRRRLGILRLAPPRSWRAVRLRHK